jgi:hypothetical protein
MKIASVFGLLLLSVSERLKRLANRLGTMGSGEVDTPLVGTTKVDNPVLIWDVVDGPYHRDEFDDDELLSVGIDDNLEYFLVVKLQENGAVGIVNFWVETAEEAYDIVEHFKTNIEPLEIT